MYCIFLFIIYIITITPFKSKCWGNFVNLGAILQWGDLQKKIALFFAHLLGGTQNNGPFTRPWGRLKKIPALLL